MQFLLVVSKGTTSGINALEMLHETVDMIEGDQQRSVLFFEMTEP